MADESDSLILTYLRRIDAKVDRLTDDVRDLKICMTGVEEAVVGLQRRMDRPEARVERVERRLDLVDMPH